MDLSVFRPFAENTPIWDKRKTPPSPTTYTYTCIYLFFTERSKESLASLGFDAFRYRKISERFFRFVLGDSPFPSRARVGDTLAASERSKDPLASLGSHRYFAIFRRKIPKTRGWGFRKNPPGLQKREGGHTDNSSRKAVPGVSIRFDFKEAIETLESAVDVKTYQRAVAAGMKYGARSAKTAMAKEVTSKYNLKSARVKKDISNPKLVDDGKTAEIRVARRPPTAGIGYRFKDNGRRVQGQYIKGRKVVISRGFQVVHGQGLVYRRIYTDAMPISVPHGPSVGSMAIGKSKFGEQIRKNTFDKFSEKWKVGVERSLRGSFKRGAQLFV